MTPAKKTSQTPRDTTPDSAPLFAPDSPDAFRARVRMYRHGLGDCFLVTIPRDGESPMQMLIDCGVLEGTSESMTAVVKHIRDTVLADQPSGEKAHLDIVVATHEHKDHLSGFNQARSVFSNDFEFGAVWLGWTENLSKPENLRIKAAKRKTLEKVRLALQYAKGIPSFALAGVSELLAFNEDDDSTGSRRISDALEYLKLRGTQAGALQYLEPGEGPLALPGVQDARVYVLGPPRDPLLLKRSEVTERMKREGIIYHLLRCGDAGLDAMGAAVDNTAGADGDRYHPFGAEHRIAEFVANPLAAGSPIRNPYFAEIQGFISKTYQHPNQAWRRIDHDWLRAFGQLALDLDNDTNNTSLVLAIEFPRTRDVLLFVGDAQVGNWLSWSKVSFNVPGRTAPLQAHELLERTVFYKVGHHCSHNATLRNGGLELMTRNDLVAFVPLDEATARKQGKHGWDMPAAPLFKALKDKTGNRTVLSDRNANVSAEATNAGVRATNLFVDYFLS
jgi:hypothetical protein